MAAQGQASAFTNLEMVTRNHDRDDRLQPSTTNATLPNRFSAIDDSSNPTNPFSAFYSHETSKVSLDRVKTEDSGNQDHKDVEAGFLKGPQVFVTRVDSQKPSLDGRTLAESSMWPSRQALEEQAKKTRKEERMKNWMCLGGLSRKQRLWTKILIIFVIIALAVGLGVGISRAVGGGVYSSDGQSKTIPQDGP